MPVKADSMDVVESKEVTQNTPSVGADIEQLIESTSSQSYANFLSSKLSRKRKNMYTLPMVLSELQPDTNLVNYLIKKNTRSVQEYDSQGLTPIHIAVNNGNLRFVMMLYDACNDCLSQLTKDQKHSSLSLAVKMGRVEISRFILSKRPNLTFFESEKGYPIHVAVLDKRNEIIKDIIKYAPDSIRVPKADGRYAIHLAATRQPAQVKLLLDFDRTQLQIQDVDGNYAQHFAAICGAVDSLKEIFSYLEDTEAIRRCLLSINQTKCTPLYMASSSGHVDMVKFLLDTCPESALIAAAKDTYPIHIACQQRHYEVVKLLLERAPQSATFARSDKLLPLNMTVRDTSSPPSLELIQLLVKAFPTAIFNENIEKLNILQILRRSVYKINSNSTESDHSKKPQIQVDHSLLHGNTIVPILSEPSATAPSSKVDESEWRILPIAQIRFVINTYPQLDEKLYRELNWYLRKSCIMISYMNLCSQESATVRDLNILARIRCVNHDVWRHIILFL